MRIVDRSVLKLIRMWLKAPVIEPEGGNSGGCSRRRHGTPQGGVISPLLANIYLHWFEKVFYGPGGPGTWAKAQIVRYADDFVVMSRYHGGRITTYIEEKIERWLGLELNRAKTKIVDLNQPGAAMDFLGYTFRYDRDRFGRGFRYLNVTPSRKALSSERQALREEISHRQSHAPIPRLIGKVNRHLNGWGLYFSFGYCRKAKRAIKQYVRVYA